MKWFLALVVGLNLVAALYGALKPHPTVDIHAQEVSPESLKLLPAGWVAASAPVAMTAKVVTSAPAAAATPTALPASLDAVPAVAPGKAAVPAPNPVEAKPVPAPKLAAVPPAPVEAAPKVAAAKPEALACYQWGPFEARQLAHVKARLASLKLGAGQLKETQSSELRGSGKFWVFHPALATPAEAQTLLAELKGKGFDGYIVQNDERKGSVSLGLFGSEASAQALAAKAKAAGYAKVQVEPRGQQVTRTRLTLGALNAQQVAHLEALQKRLLPGVPLAACP